MDSNFKFNLPESIRNRLRVLPSLPSLNTIQGALRELMDAEEKSTFRLVSILRKDPSLAARLLQSVNSPEYGLAERVNSLEDAVIQVGAQTLRSLVLMAPVVSDLKVLAGPTSASWRDLWKHSVSVALLTQDILVGTGGAEGDLDYVAGLLHDVGWILIRSAFPIQYTEIARRIVAGEGSAEEIELSVLGVSHSVLGAWYLSEQKLDPVLCLAALHHESPSLSLGAERNVAAVNIADHFALSLNRGHAGESKPAKSDIWKESIGWDILFGDATQSGRRFAQRRLEIGSARLMTIADTVI